MSGLALTAGQAAALRSAAEAAAGADAAGADAAGAENRRFVLPGNLPDSFSQAMRGSCVANAVAAMVEYAEGRRERLSVQYLAEATRIAEADWTDRNLALMRRGNPVEPDFAAAFPGPVRQVEMLVKANVPGTPAADAFVDSFGRQVRKRLAGDGGARLKRTFEALSRFGICRYDLWPYARVAMGGETASADALGEFPPGSHKDARRRRIPMRRLYVLRSPNNVEELKRLLSGEGSRLPMPVCLGVELFDGCDDETFSLPHVADGPEGPVTAEDAKGLHEIMLYGYEDDPAMPGGGCFLLLNSWGEEWGDKGRGRIPYAYVECFAREAGTISRKRGGKVGACVAGALAAAVLAAAIVAFAPSRTPAAGPQPANPPEQPTITAEQPPPTVEQPPITTEPPPNPPEQNQPPIEQSPNTTEQAGNRTPEKSPSGGGLVVERNLVEWNYALRIDCATRDDARAVFRALLKRRAAEFFFEPDDPPPKNKTSIRGTVVFEAPKSRPPLARKILREHLQRFAPSVSPKDLFLVPLRGSSR